ncbi:hypothetical protein [Micromonospora craniellae]|uniref:Uncharacterized protein n=1 Tax=Micromonospora craniellae TaxID=2294034 RepID=A0A372FTU3_9ACTN|nr:hypothetical protein [Micromonospora craniellae]QOC89697.1 hypothetical protein ID554_15585 [Micromonospora craniellae]RFS44171.1 hypothetical protein D0Q02_23735 [Micromonospora craniellae]
MVYRAPNAQQLVEMLTDAIRRHDGNPALLDRVLVDVSGVRVPIDFVDLFDVTDECQQTGCHCGYGQEDRPEDAPRKGVHFEFLIGGDVP